jgi:hypothetical protein
LAQPRRQIEALGDLCCEAAVEFGDDWRGIERYVTDRVSRLPVEQQQALLEDVLMTLRFQPPGDFARDRCKTSRLNQPQAPEARVPVLAHDNVVMHGNAQRVGDGDDLLRHLNVGAGRRRIARGMVVQDTL